MPISKERRTVDVYVFSCSECEWEIQVYGNENYEPAVKKLESHAKRSCPNRPNKKEKK